MFDINAIINAAITAAVQQAITEALQQHANTVAPLIERITALENNPAIGVDTTLAARVTALETKLAEANLFTQNTNVTIPVDEARMVEALNSQEWFWEKLQGRIADQIDHAQAAHCDAYDHDSYDQAVSTVDDLPSDFDEFVTKDDLRGEIEEALNHATVTFNI